MPVETAPKLIDVTSGKFKAWAFDPQTGKLWVRFHPSKKKPLGSVGFYSHVSPDEWLDAGEEESKGKWLIAEMINCPERHPWTAVDEDQTSPSEPTPEGGITEADIQAVDPAYKADEPEKIVYTKGPMPKESLIPEPIREIAVIPPAPKLTIPEILAPDVAEGEKPFAQLVRERALAVAGSVPISLIVTSADAYKALGTALVVIQKERIAVDKALADLAAPIVDYKRKYDNWRGVVLEQYASAESRLNAALQAFKRADDARVAAEQERLRREAADKARKLAQDQQEAEQKRQKEEAEQMRIAAEARIAEAKNAITIVEASPADDGLFLGVADEMISDAREEIAEAEKEIEAAKELAAAPVPIQEVYVPVATVAKTDLKVSGLRRKPPLWRWRIPAKFFKDQRAASVLPIRRNALHNPDSIPAEYWILDEKAVSGMVKDMQGVVSVAALETYDENA